MILAAIPLLVAPSTWHERVSLDTNIPSEILRPRPDANVAAWLNRQANRTLLIRVVTMGELLRGITLLVEQSPRRVELERMIQETVSLWFQDRILPVTRTIAERWGVLDGERQLVMSCSYEPKTVLA